MPQPNKIPLAFAASGDKNTIPESTETTGLASWREGFPAITSAPFSEGGIAPKRADFNGIFNALSLATLWQQQGGFYAYDNATDYEVGNVVLYSGDLYKCLSANGPSSAVKAPTDATVWSKVMTASDVAALYLSLSGGAMSGDISNAGTGFRRLLGGSSVNDGAYVAVAHENNAQFPGEFWLVAKTAVEEKDLIGKPDGTLMWDGKSVVTVETGTWTPTVYGGSTEGATTISNNNSFYHKFGNLVYVRAKFRFIITSSPAGEVRFGGVPYNPDDFYWGVLAANNNAGIIANLHQNGWVRPSAYNTSTGMENICSWGSTAAHNVWANTVNKTDVVFFEIWYHTSA